MFQADFHLRLSLSNYKNIPEALCESDVIRSEPASFFANENDHAFSAFATGKPTPILPIEKEIVEFCYGHTQVSIDHNKTTNGCASKAAET